MKKSKNLKKTFRISALAALFVVSLAFVIGIFDLTGMRIGYIGFMPAVGSAIGLIESI